MKNCNFEIHFLINYIPILRLALPVEKWLRGGMEGGDGRNLPPRETESDSEFGASLVTK